MCSMIKNSQKWYILDQYWWLVCFPVCFVCPKSIQICFFLRSRMFVIYYKSKYSSDMFYEWNFSEMVHPGSALMAGVFSCLLCMFCCLKKHPDMFFLVIQCLWFITNLNIAQICFMIEISQKIAHSGSVMMACMFYVLCVCLLA